MTETSDISDRVPSVCHPGSNCVPAGSYSVNTTFLQNRWFSAVSVQK